MAKVFERGLTTPTGYVLPVQRWNAIAAQTRWVTREVEDAARQAVPRARRLAGRLPPAAVFAEAHPADVLSACRADATRWRRADPLPEPEALLARQAAACRRRPARSPPTRRSSRSATEQEISEIEGEVRTAITVEVRDGHLCVFLPPVETLEDYLELVAAAEAAAKSVGLPVPDRGLSRRRPIRGSTSSASRPTPASSRSTSTRPRTGTTASRPRPRSTRRRRQTRLGADKFMIDGRHTGTGGGNHVVVGGVDARRQPVPAPARPAQVAGAALAAPSRR